MTVFATLMLFVCQYIAFVSMLSIFLQERKAIKRLEKYVREPNRPKMSAQIRVQNIRNIFKLIGDRLSGIAFFNRYQRFLKNELDKADILLRVEEVTAISLSLSIIGIVYYIVTKNLFMSFLLILFFWILPFLIITEKKRKRLKQINDQLGDVLVLISNSLKAGYSFLQAIETVANDMAPPISNEFGKVIREINLGVHTEKALNNLVERVGSRDLEMVIMAILIQRQVGGNLAEILDNISFTIRERIKLKGEIKTATAQGRISATVISLLPIFLAIILFTLNPEYISKLFTNPIGLGMLFMGIFMQIIGMIMIKKIISIEM